jgi:hypothetical protein
MIGGAWGKIKEKMLVRESWHKSHDGAATRGNRVIGNSRRGHPKKPMRRGIDDITPCSLPPTGERNSYHNGCSETGQGVEQDGLVAAVVRAEQKSRYHHAGIKVDEIQAMTKEKLACPA